MKRYAKIIALAFACAMALCLFTACGNDNSVDSYIKSLGASESIQQSDELESIAGKYIDAGVASYSYGKSINENKPVIISAVSSVDTKGVKVDGSYFDITVFGYSLTVYLDGSGKEITDKAAITKEIAAMSSYGLASKKLYGNSISINAVTFAK